MSHARCSSSAWLVGTLAITLCIPGSLMAVVAAKQSRMMIVYADDDPKGILDLFESNADASGLRCQHSTTSTGNPLLHCSPKSDAQGGITVVNRPEKRAIVISAFARNVSSPRGELDPPLDAALTNFMRALVGHPHVVHIDYCWAPRLGCVSFVD